MARSEIQGTVVDAQSGRPVAGAIVVAVRLAGTFEGASTQRAQIAETLSDSSGAFRLRLGSPRVQLMLSTRREVFAAAMNHRPLVADLDELIEQTQPQGVAPAGHITLRLEPLGARPADGGLREFVLRLTELYARVQLYCMVAEIPRMAAFLSEAGALDSAAISSKFPARADGCDG